MTYIFWFTLILLLLLIIWMGRRRYIWVRLLTKDFTIKFSGYARNIWLRVGIGNHLARHPKHGPLKDINHSADSYPTYSSNKCLSTSSAHINTPSEIITLPIPIPIWTLVTLHSFIFFWLQLFHLIIVVFFTNSSIALLWFSSGTCICWWCDVP